MNSQCSQNINPCKTVFIFRIELSQYIKALLIHVQTFIHVKQIARPIWSILSHTCPSLQARLFSSFLPFAFVTICLHIPSFTFFCKQEKSPGQISFVIIRVYSRPRKFLLHKLETQKKENLSSLSFLLLF